MDSTNPVGLGILGCAGIARKNVRAVGKAKGIELKAVGSRSIEKAKNFVSDLLPGNTSVRTYGSYEEVIDDPAVDAVYIPLPTALHVEWALKASAKGKHILLEKPTAMNVKELDEILSSCRKHNVKLMDGTMWMHNPRNSAIKNLVSDQEKFGDLKYINASFFVGADDAFLAENIRTKPDLDGLGAMGDLGWYCVRAALWARDYQMPYRVTALPEPQFNGLGVVMRCGATLCWRDGVIATFDCGFDSHLRQHLDLAGRFGHIRLDDFVIPRREDKSKFLSYHKSWFLQDAIGIDSTENLHEVELEIPQEASMLEELAGLVRRCKAGGESEDPTDWEEISRKTQMVVDAAMESIRNEGKSITI